MGADSGTDPGAGSASEQGDGKPAAGVGSSKNTSKAPHRVRKKTKSTKNTTKKASSEKASAEVPEKLASAEIRATLAKIEVAKCSQFGALPGMKVKVKVKVKVKLLISADGAVVSADALKPFKGMALGRCVATTAKGASFGKAEKGQIYTHVFKL